MIFFYFYALKKIEYTSDDIEYLGNEIQYQIWNFKNVGVIKLDRNLAVIVCAHLAVLGFITKLCN